jgi:hypothetical protein
LLVEGGFPSFFPLVLTAATLFPLIPKTVTLPLPALVHLLPLADLLLLPRKQEGEKEEERRRKEDGCTNLRIFVVDHCEIILI